MIECKICSSSHENVRKFSKHINFYHDTDLESYYSEFILLPNKCVICGIEDTRFVNFTHGYSDCCSSRKCAAIHYRSKLKADKSKFESFTNKVSSNMKSLWKDTDTTTRITNMSNSMSNTISKMTADERKYKFGWLNRLSLDDRQNYISKIMMNTGAHIWWKTASDKDKREVYDRRANTLSATWDERGSEIMLKMTETFIKNSKNIPFYIDINSESYLIMDKKLSKIFQL